MRRWLTIAAFSSALVMVSPVLAQMHGGSRGGASMGRGGFSSGGSIGMRSSSGFGGGQHFAAGAGTWFRQQSFSSGRSFSSGSFSNRSFGFRGTHFGPDHFHHRVFFSSFSPHFFGYYGYPAYYGGYGYSTADYPGYDYYGSGYSNEAYSNQNDVAQQQQDIDRLEDEVARLREQRNFDHQSSDAPSPQPASRSEVSAPTVLVFRDKHTQEVQNYAIVGGTLWIFSDQRATKLPLSWLDPEATSKANEDRGLDFQLPK
jgi:hypothetical protein